MQKKKIAKPGFFLIELLTSLIILSVFLFVITSYFSRTIQWNYNTKLRMRAINIALETLATIIAKKNITNHEKKSIDPFNITIQPETIDIDQKNTDLLLSPKENNKKKKMFFSPIKITVSWLSVDSKPKKFELLSGVILQGKIS